jgi:type II secretory pathway pseudopilin PulG
MKYTGKRADAGMSLIELMMAMAFFATIALTLASTMVVAIDTQTENRDQTVAVNIAQNTMESIRALTFVSPAASTRVALDDGNAATEPLQEFYTIFKTVGGTEVDLTTSVSGHTFFITGVEVVTDSLGVDYNAAYLEDPFGNRVRLLGMDFHSVTLTMPSGLDADEVGDSEVPLPVIITVKWRIKSSTSLPDLRTYKLPISLYQTYQ